MKLTPTEWINRKYPGLVVLDPDGWDRSNYEEDWARPITEQEFEDKLSVSTVNDLTIFVTSRKRSI